MKFLPLLLANLKRKKIRTTLTIGSFVVAFFLFGLLGAIRYGFRQGIDVAGADRLVVIGRTSIIQPLPLPYFDRIKRLPGVKDVAHSTWFGGIYQDPKNFFAQFAIVPEDWLRMYPEFTVDPAQWKAFLDDRQGCVIGAKLADRFGWKIGDKIPLKVARLLRRRQLGLLRPRDLPRHAGQRRRDAVLDAPRLPVREGARASGRASSAGTSSASPTPTRRSPSPRPSTRSSPTRPPSRARRPSRRLRRRW